MAWWPEACPLALPAAAHPLAPEQAGDGFDLYVKRACTTTLLLAPDGTQHVRFADRTGRSLQLTVTGADLLAAPRLLRYEIAGVRTLRHRAKALAQLDGVIRRRHLLAKLYPPEPRRRRLLAVLRALDADLAGTPHREIAAALFGTAFVETTWRDPRQNLQDRVRRAVRRGRWLSAGGYRAFLA